MAVYLTGLVLVTAAIELTLSLLLASQGKVPSPSSDFWPAYLLVDIGMVAGGATLAARGLHSLRLAANSSEPGQGTPPDG